MIVPLAAGEPVGLLDAIEAAADQLEGVRVHQMHALHDRPYLHGGVREHLQHISYFLSPVGWGAAFAAMVGQIGSLQATEAVKEILGIGTGMSGRLLLWDALEMRFRDVRLGRDPACALCGEDATIRDLSCHRAPAHPGSTMVVP